MAQKARRVALVDGLVVLTLLFLLFSTQLAPASREAVFLYAIGSLVIAAFVSWRGYRFAQAALQGTARWYRPVIEGFVAGFVPTFVWLTALAANAAFAAGRPYDGAADWGVSEWLAYLGVVLQVSLLLGGLGAAVGLVLSAINRFLLRAAA